MVDCPLASFTSLERDQPRRRQALTYRSAECSSSCETHLKPPFLGFPYIDTDFGVITDFSVPLFLLVPLFRPKSICAVLHRCRLRSPQAKLQQNVSELEVLVRKSTQQAIDRLDKKGRLVRFFLLCRPAVPCYRFFFWEGSPTKSKLQKKGCLYSNLSTGGPSLCLTTLRGNRKAQTVKVVGTRGFVWSTPVCIAGHSLP